MIYVGASLPKAKHGGVENCLINPELRLSPKESDRSGQSMPYWPSYSDIPPKARRAYLEWLAGGRCDPEIGVGYVFLFFYGLERRYFVDGARHEGKMIADEVRRLLAIYGASNSFRGYANRLLDVIAVTEAGSSVRPTISPDLRSGYEMPMPVRLYLGRRLAEKAPLDAEDALLWLLALPDMHLRTPATRCFDEFVTLWKLRFRERHPNGLKVNAPRAPIKLEYRAASGTFESTINVTAGSGPVPDIAAVSAPLDGLKDLANACTDALDPYSRLIGRKPEARGSLEAALLLPKELAAGSGSSPLKPILDQFEFVFAGRAIAPVTVARLIEILGLNLPGTKLTAAACNQIGGLLDRLDIALEPDRRYGSSGMSRDGRAILFKSSGGAAVDPEKAAYKLARTLIEVTALAASADGIVAAEEYEAVKGELRMLPDLTTIEHARLLAYAGLLMNDTPRQQSVLSKLATLPDATRRQVAQSAIGAVLADGHATPGEVKFIEKLYKALGYSADDVYAALHRGAVVIDGPVVVSPEEPARGIAIPARPGPPTPGVRIDAARLQRLQQETSAVSALLAGIFVEDEPPSPPPKPPTAEAATRSIFSGLDDAHGTLLRGVLGVGAINRAEFENRARALRLLPDGAFETINEWGFETFDEPILEGDDPITVADHLRAQLEKMETA